MMYLQIDLFGKHQPVDRLGNPIVSPQSVPNQSDTPQNTQQLALNLNNPRP